MNPSAPFIQRPVATTLLMVGVVLFGLLGYTQLPVSDLPNVDYPVISVSAGLPGASPETMASSVATPLEKQLSTISGLETMTSSSGLGSTNITMQFALTRNVDAAAQDVQAAISKVLRQLPQGILPPSYQKVNPADSPILFLALVSDVVPLPRLNDLAETMLAQRISTVSGVAQVQVFGSQKYAVRVQADPERLALQGLTLGDLATAIDASNPSLPTGVLTGAERALTVRADGSITSAAQFRDVVVAQRSGRPVRLGDVSRVFDSVQDDKAASWYNGRRGLVLAVQRQPGTNTVAVANGVHSMVEKLRPQLPASVHLETLYDRSQSIRHSVTDVQFTLGLTLVLVVLVIFLFLRRLRATIIPSLALPLSVLGTFAIMRPLGYNLDNLSLMALTLSVGFVVDDAIVMLENIVRHLDMGKTPMRAALDGSKEIGFTIVSMTLSLVAVFIPVLFMGGLLGRLFHEFAVVISIAILVSGVVSLTLTPMLCSRWLSHTEDRRESRFDRSAEGVYQSMLRAYERSLHWAMRHRRAVLAMFAVILVGTIALFMFVPKGFLPTEDNGQIVVTTETPEGTPFASHVRHQQELAAIIARDPDVAGFMSSAGGGNNASGQGRMILRLRDRPARRRSADQMVRELAPRLAAVPGIRAFLQVPPTVRVGGRVSKSQYQYTLQGTDVTSLFAAAAGLEGKLRGVQEIENVTSDLQIRNPELRVHIDRGAAAARGVTPEQIERGLYDAYGSRQISTIFTTDNQYWVVLEVAPELQRDADALARLPIRSASGALVPVGAVAQLSRGVGPLSINHSGQLPSVTLSFDLKRGVALGAAVAAVERAARTTLPSSVTPNFSGTAQVFQASQQGLAFLLLVAVLVIYLVLGVLYESFIHPLTILSGLPFAGFGALLTLLIFRMPLDVYGFVGVVMLVGLVKKNAIMMIDFAVETERRGGSSAAEAIVEACLVRFRPIMMTTLAALMGTLPVALGLGAGAESRRPLGLAVVGGLAFSQFITLYVTPVIYTYLDGLRRRRKPPASGVEVVPDDAPRALASAGH